MVTRISRVHSIWFTSVDNPATDTTPPIYAEPVMEPRPIEQPNGTQVVLAYRGATNVTNAVIATDATMLDPYGDPTTGAAPTFLGDATWKNSIAGIQGATFLQLRITFIGNPETNLTAELSSLGFSYRR
jgi:hypothetical protein